MRARSFVSIGLMAALVAAPAAHAGKEDLRSGRFEKRDPAKQAAQEAQKQRLLARLRADAPAVSENREPVANPLDVPLFKQRWIAER